MKRIVTKAFLILMFIGVIAQAHSSAYGTLTSPIVEVVSVETGKLTFNTWNQSFYFYKNEVLTAKITVKNNDNTPRNSTIYVNGIDNLEVPFGIFIGTIELQANETMAIYASIYIPAWAFSGTGTITAFAKTLPDGTYCPQVTTYFYLSQAPASYLKMQTSSKNNMDTGATIDNAYGSAPATVELDPGSHALQVDSVVYDWYAGVYYKYTFDHWENGLQSTARTINISTSTNQTVTAYYSRSRAALPAPLSSSLSSN